jgi:Protein of unknown function (DUF1517)
VGSLADRFNQFAGRTRIVVCRILLHLSGDGIAPLLGVLNQVGEAAIDSDGDLQVLGEGLVEVCTSLLRYETYWKAAANEGDALWDEGEADDYVNQLFMDSAQRYLSGSDWGGGDRETLTTMPVQNMVVMLTIACEGEVPALETDLSQMATMKQALQTIAGLHQQERLRAIQVHFSPASYGDVLTSDQVLENFSELIPL